MKTFPSLDTHAHLNPSRIVDELTEKIGKIILNFPTKQEILIIKDHLLYYL
jgi:hypothetical protein